MRGVDSVDLCNVIPDGEMTALLWQMTDARSEVITQEVEHDARMHVAIRSLLRPISTDDDDSWQVAFFHRPVMEYFLTRLSGPVNQPQSSEHDW